MTTAVCPHCQRIVHLDGSEVRFCPVCATALVGSPEAYRPDVAAMRLAKNEVIFREANERIRDGAEGSQREDVAFVCECAQQNCNEPLWLSLEEHRQVRENATWFITVPGHEIEGLERVVGVFGDYQVVEKLGPARAIAEGTAPQMAEGN